MLNTNFAKNLDFQGQRFYIGLDVHKKSWAVTIRSLGIQVAHFIQTPSPEGLLKYLNKNFPGGQYYSAYEAGFSGTHIHEELCTLGINNIIIHAADMPSTDKQKKNKTDLHDSRSIAENLERGSLHGIHVLSRQQQELRGLFRLRQHRVKDVTRANNRLKSFLMYFGVELPETIGKKEYMSIKALEWLSKLHLESASGSITLQQYTEELKYQRKQLYQITKLLREQIRTSHARAYECLLSVPGIGGVTCMGLIAEIADFKRFDDPDKYCSFLGLCPWEDSSGESIKTKGMQPRCNKYLRPLLIEASWTAIKRSPVFFSYYSKHAVKNSKRAIAKVARKLALTAKGVVTKEQLYQEDYIQQKQQEQQKQKNDRKQKRFSKGMTEQHIKKSTRKSLKSLPG